MSQMKITTSYENWATFLEEKTSFTVFKPTSGDKCAEGEAATGSTDGGPAGELFGDGEQLLISHKTEADFRGK